MAISSSYSDDIRLQQFVLHGRTTKLKTQNFSAIYVYIMHICIYIYKTDSLLSVWFVDAQISNKHIASQGHFY